MKLEEILAERQVFRHPSGQVETLDDYAKKTFKQGRKAGRRLRHKAKKSMERRRQEQHES